MIHLEKIQEIVSNYIPNNGDPVWLIDKSPKDNLGFFFTSKIPIFKLAFSNMGWCETDDPDIEMSLFSNLEDAYECIYNAATSITGINTDQYESVNYQILETSKGFLVLWFDDALEFGGNISFADGHSKFYLAKEADSNACNGAPCYEIYSWESRNLWAWPGMPSNDSGFSREPVKL